MSFQGRLSEIHAIDRNRDPAGRELLEAAIVGDDERLAEAAAEALGRIGDPSALSTLTALLHHHDAQRTAGAIRGLIALGDRAALEPLRALSDDARPYRAWGESPEGGHHQTVGRLAATAIARLTQAC
jgi:HEAT repeat protein